MAEYIKRADKIRSKSILRSLFRDEYKDMNECMNLYCKAAVQYKLDEQWQDAAECYIQAAQCIGKYSEFDSYKYILNAADCYSKVDVSLAVEYYLEYIQYCVDNGRLSTAAKCSAHIATLYEEDLDTDSAIRYKTKACTYYRGDGGYQSNYSSELRELAILYTGKQEYQVAAQLFRDARSENPSVLGYLDERLLFDETICMLAIGDVVAARKLLEGKYKGDIGKLRSLVDSIDNMDMELFTLTLRSLEPRLDNWMITALLQVRQTFDEEDDA